MKLPRPTGPRVARPHDSYELCGGEIARGRGLRPNDKVRVAEIASWQVFPEMVFDVVEITLVGDGRVVWLDKHNDLTSILRRAAPKGESRV